MNRFWVLIALVVTLFLSGCNSEKEDISKIKKIIEIEKVPYSTLDLNYLLNLKYKDNDLKQLNFSNSILKCVTIKNSDANSVLMVGVKNMEAIGIEMKKIGKKIGVSEYGGKMMKAKTKKEFQSLLSLYREEVAPRLEQFNKGILQLMFYGPVKEARNFQEYMTIMANQSMINYLLKPLKNSHFKELKECTFELLDYIPSGKIRTIDFIKDNKAIVNFENNTSNSFVKDKDNWKILK